MKFNKDIQTQIIKFLENPWYIVLGIESNLFSKNTPLNFDKFWINGRKNGYYSINNLKNWSRVKDYNIIYLRLIDHTRDRYIHKIEKLPDNLKSLYIANSKTIPKLPENLENLEINCCSMSEISNLPNNLESLTISNMDITYINLPDNLKELYIDELHCLNNIQFPKNLVELCIRRSTLYDIPYLEKLERLQLSKQSISSLHLNDNVHVNIVKDVDFYGPIYVSPNFDFSKNFGGCCAPDINDLEIIRSI
jgi:hypothetical protein